MAADQISTATTNPLKQTLLENGVLRLDLNSPPANALSESMLDTLQSAFDAAAKDETVRVIILGAEGKLYCAGHDLKELTAARATEDRGRVYFQDIMKRCAKVMQTIVNHPKPVIAEVNGLATAAGCQLVASCDLAIASDEAAFCAPGVHIGLFCSTPMVALSRNIHPKHAMEMLLTGEAVDASVARENGLVNRVVPKEYLRQVTVKFAEAIASKSAMTLKTGKQAFYKQLDMGLSEAYEYTAQVMSENMLAKDAEEGIAAFLEHRVPEWTDE